VSLGLFIIEVFPSHSDAPHSVGLRWTSDGRVAETSTRQQTKFTRDTQPRLRPNSNPQP